MKLNLFFLQQPEVNVIPYKLLMKEDGKYSHVGLSFSCFTSAKLIKVSGELCFKMPLNEILNIT